jgi:hypothetical protein
LYAGINVVGWDGFVGFVVLVVVLFVLVVVVYMECWVVSLELLCLWVTRTPVVEQKQPKVLLDLSLTIDNHEGKIRLVCC